MKRLKLALVLATVFAAGNLSSGSLTKFVPVAHAQTTGQKTGFISNYRAVIDRLNAAMEQEKTLRSQYTALSLSSAIVDGDFTGDNVGITAAQLTAAVSSMDTMQTAYGATVRQNLYRIGH
jgi:hypothetical protein